MLKINCIVDGQSDGTVTEARCSILIDGKKVIGFGGFIIDQLEQLMNYIDKNNQIIWRGYFSHGLSFFIKLFSETEIEISYQEHLSRQPVWDEKQESFIVNKNEFKDEIVRVVDEFIDEVGWRDENIVACETNPGSVRDFVVYCNTDIYKYRLDKIDGSCK